MGEGGPNCLFQLVPHTVIYFDGGGGGVDYIMGIFLKLAYVIPIWYPYLSIIIILSFIIIPFFVTPF